MSKMGSFIEGEVTEPVNTKKNLHANRTPKNYGDVTYTNKTIIKRLRKHMVDDMLSKYSMTKPRFTAIQRRMDQGDLELKEQVAEVIAEHYAAFERMSIQAIRGEIDVDSKMFRLTTQNKKPFLSPEQLAISEGIAPTVAPVAPQLHFHQIGTREDFEQLEHRNKDDDAI